MNLTSIIALGVPTQVLADADSFCQCGHRLGEHSAPDFGCSVCVCPGFSEKSKVVAYSEDQPRDTSGKWTGDGDQAANIMHQKTGGAAGSNAGGFYKGVDGVTRYVKSYGSPTQAHGEAVANAIYRDLGVPAPKSIVFKDATGTKFASEVVQGGKTMQALGITTESARAVLKGFAADVLVGNWDVIGLYNDNILMKDGVPHRVDNGASFFHRAQGGKLKPESTLNKTTEFEGFFNPQVNREYSRLAAVAGVSKPQEIADLKGQVQKIVALQDAHGGWSSYLDKAAPFLSASDHDKMANMLTARTSSLAQKVGMTIHAGGPGSGWFTSSPNPHVGHGTKAPMDKQLALQKAGFKLKHADDEKDVYEHTDGGVQVHVSKYNTTHPGNTNLRKYTVIHKEQGKLFTGHQFNKAMAATKPPNQTVTTKPVQTPTSQLPSVDPSSTDSAHEAKVDILKQNGFAYNGMKEQGNAVVEQYQHPFGPSVDLNKSASTWALNDHNGDAYSSGFGTSKLTSILEPVLNDAAKAHEAETGVKPAASIPFDDTKQNVTSFTDASTLKNAGFKFSNSVKSGGSGDTYDHFYGPGGAVVRVMKDGMDGTTQYMSNTWDKGSQFHTTLQDALDQVAVSKTADSANAPITSPASTTKEQQEYLEAHDFKYTATGGIQNNTDLFHNENGSIISISKNDKGVQNFQSYPMHPSIKAPIQQSNLPAAIYNVAAQEQIKTESPNKIVTPTSTPSPAPSTDLKPTIPASFKNKTLQDAGYVVKESGTINTTGQAYDLWAHPTDSTKPKIKVKSTVAGTSVFDAYDPQSLMTVVKDNSSGSTMKSVIADPSSYKFGQPAPTVLSYHHAGDYAGVSSMSKADHAAISDLVDASWNKYNSDAFSGHANRTYSDNDVPNWTDAYNKLVTDGAPAGKDTMVKAAEGKGLYPEVAAKMGMSPRQLSDAMARIRSWTGTSTDSFRMAAQGVRMKAPTADPGLALEYNVTQKALQDLHPSGTISLYRGLKSSQVLGPDSENNSAQVFALRGLVHLKNWSTDFDNGGAASWSVSKDTAEGFKAGQYGIVVHQPDVPIQDVLTSHATNPVAFGSHNSEKEYIVAPMHGKMRLEDKKTKIFASSETLQALQHMATLRQNGWTVAINKKHITLTPPNPDYNWLQDMRSKPTVKAYALEGKTMFQGLPISIETKKGSVRSGKKPDGTPWSVTMPFDYGYIRGTMGVDGDHVDCFIGPNPDAKFAYVIHQTKQDSSDYDEDKVMLGWNTSDAAKKAYASAYDDGVGTMHSMTILPMSTFIEKVNKTGKQKRPGKIHAVKKSDVHVKLRPLMLANEPGNSKPGISAKPGNYMQHTTFTRVNLDRVKRK